ncbi:MAG TPA: RDD family protein [Actinomycetota bacterium]|jgi:uncharacterized RDD family membrane protein YckC
MAELVSALPREARDLQGATAGIVSRLLAGAVDYAVTALLLVALWVGAHGVRFLLRPRTFSWEDIEWPGTVGAFLIVLTLYLAFGWATTGRTVGDQVLGLRVLSSSGGRIHPLVALGRGAFYALVPLGLLWSAVDAHRRSVQDLLLRTTVVYDWTHRVPRGADHA